MVGASCNPDLGFCDLVKEGNLGMRYDQNLRHNTSGNTILPIYCITVRLHEAAGITILDITDPSDVRYCFVDFCGIHSERQVPLHTPLDGWTYLRAYHHIGDDIVLRNKAAVDGLEKYALVELADLAGQFTFSFILLPTASSQPNICSLSDYYQMLSFGHANA